MERLIAVLMLVGCLVGCSSVSEPIAPIDEALLGYAVPSPNEERVWVEPMFDTVEVPAQIDAKGTYYRLKHKAVVEIRPDRYQPVEYPTNKGQQ